MRLLTWNLGSFVFMKYQRYFCAGNFDHQEYFQPILNARLVSQTIESINPDFLYLQEFYHPEDVERIGALAQYPFQQLIDTWYREKSVLIASKKPFSARLQSGVLLVEFEHYHFYPVHLNSFFPQKRLQESLTLKDVSAGLDNVAILGDLNLWLWKSFSVWRNDTISYRTLTQRFIDTTAGQPTTCYGFELDKILITPDIRIERVETPRIRGKFMDHYPVYCDILT